MLLCNKHGKVSIHTLGIKHFDSSILHLHLKIVTLLIRPYVYRGISCVHYYCEIVTFQDLFWTACLWGGTKARWVHMHFAFWSMICLIFFNFSGGSTCTATAESFGFVSEMFNVQLGRCMCIVLSYVLGIFSQWRPNSQVLVLSKIPKGTEANVVWVETRDAATTSVIFISGGQVMLKHSTCTDNGQHSELVKPICTGWCLKDRSLKLSRSVAPLLFYSSSFYIRNV